MMTKHKRKFVTQTPQVLWGQCCAISEDGSLTPEERMQALNRLRRDVLSTHGFHSSERRVIDDFIRKAEKGANEVVERAKEAV